MVQPIDEPLSRTEAIRRLRALEPALRDRGVQSLYLFGSTARDQARSDSDIDVFADLDPRRTFAFDYFSLGFVIEDELRRKTDFIGRKSLHPAFRDEIEASAVRIF